MQDILRDPIWQFLGLVISIIVSILIYRLQRLEKSLSYSIISKTSKIKVDHGIEGNLKVTFNDSIIQDLSVVVISIANSGRSHIKPEDFYEPIKISFGKNTNILSVRVWGNPSDVKPQIKEKTTEYVIIDPLLLNKNDKIDCEFFLSGFDEIIRVEGRVVDVKKINNKPLRRITGVVAYYCIYSIFTIYEFVQIYAQAYQSLGFYHVRMIPLLFAVILYIFAALTLITRAFLGKNDLFASVFWMIVFILTNFTYSHYR